MAIGTKSDFVIYHEQFFMGVTETLEQNTAAFNAESRNGIRLITQAKLGDYEQKSYVEIMANLITRRIPTTTTAVTDLAMTMDEFVSVKLNRKIGPAAQTLDAFRKVGRNPSLFSALLGEQAAKAIMVDYVNAAINSIDAALSGVAGMTSDGSAASAPAGPGLTHTALVNGLAKMGDAQNRVICWVTHSTTFFGLMKTAIADKIFEVAGVTIMQGTIASFNRPTIVIDSPQLSLAGTPAKFVTLGLVADGGVIVESEEREIVSETVTGLENLITRVQGEYAFNSAVKGFKWNISGGGANPDDTALGSSANWLKAATDNKSLAGVRMITTGA